MKVWLVDFFIALLKHKPDMFLETCQVCELSADLFTNAQLSASWRKDDEQNYLCRYHKKT
jgi:hypothetical protein